MAKQFPSFADDHLRLIAEQQMFFVATAAPTGRVNLSPKGMDSLRVTGPNQLIWLNVTGSGNETDGHLRLDPRMTVMWCSFTKRPVILRAYGSARAVYARDAEWDALYAQFIPIAGARQIYVLEVDLVQTSCGYAVPFFDFAGERDTLKTWAGQRDDEALSAYWEQKNRQTIDGFPTGLLD
ncbi:pyridoxamine 5'-phosphate oxidase family protein [Pararhodobacter zhoushanensis]|uniref:pyridoxamine 5'-phosphate oxidase family protein n=1 Tax=Pararhodobacter zhoushanensis TaxID=2479545 RepID=UPI000F8C8070|nr:pyridoxamine 5'-phosphate oxidase family protein [Pararhodobacter zhoushanensis]